MGCPHLARLFLASSQIIPTFEPFFEAPIINMPNIFGNMVYLNVKERDRF